MNKGTIAVILLALVSNAQAADKKTALTGDQLKSEFVGKTWRLVWTDGKQSQPGSQTLAADGTTTVLMDSGYKDEGTWTIKGDLLCSKFKKVPKSVCSPIYSIDGGKFLWIGTTPEKKGQSTTFSQ